MRRIPPIICCDVRWYKVWARALVVGNAVLLSNNYSESHERYGAQIVRHQSD